MGAAGVGRREKKREIQGAWDGIGGARVILRFSFCPPKNEGCDLATCCAACGSYVRYM
jgi:hypothetical protein